MKAVKNSICKETVSINKLLASVFSLSHKDHTVVCFSLYQSPVVITNRNLIFILFNVTLDPMLSGKKEKNYLYFHGFG